MHFRFPEAKTHFLPRFFSLLLFSIFLFWGFGYAAQEEKPSDQVEAVADNLQYLKAERKLVGEGNVVVVYGDVELTADRAEIETDTKKAHAQGHVVIHQKGGGTLSGD